jgi:hypothetical protein
LRLKPVAPAIALALLLGGCGTGTSASAKEAAALLSREEQRQVSLHDPRVHELARIIDSLQRRCAKVDRGVNARWIESLITDARTRPRLEQSLHGYLATARALDLMIPDEPSISCYEMLAAIGGA